MENPKKILERLGTWPKKKLGQNFLVNLASAEKIYRFADPTPNCPVIEIGPGLGAMTEVILNQNHPFLCIEKDKDLVPFLNQHFSSFKNFHCLEHDILTWDFDFSPYSKDKEKPWVIANLPYSITTPIIETLFDQREHLGSLCFLLQREFVERICAQENTKNYGRLSVWLQCYYDVEAGPIIPPTSFHPRPKVDSRLVKLTPKKTNLLQKHKIKDDEAFFALIKTVFSQRRKMLRSTLKQGQFNLDKIDPKLLQQRPETLSLTDFFKLYQALL
ncbi:16S rRNA (adenine(1518)-N(6)/adenine(1519)-N(6))-dimethyltransferase RsmA [bacterium]|nr:16S rRNA (adenine(1518)-N(6)/adenine(1519)-N(6))-dimethyltransferase RsmA [bacterium]